MRLQQIVTRDTDPERVAELEQRARLLASRVEWLEKTCERLEKHAAQVAAELSANAVATSGLAELRRSAARTASELAMLKAKVLPLITAQHRRDGLRRQIIGVLHRVRNTAHDVYGAVTLETPAARARRHTEQAGRDWIAGFADGLRSVL
jgi:hypothetical protein